MSETDRPPQQTAQSAERQPSKPFLPVLTLFIIVGATFFFGRPYIQSFLAGRLGSTVWHPILKVFEQTDLPAPQKLAILKLLRDVGRKHKSGEVTERQLYNVSMHLSKRLIAKMIRIRAIFHRQYQSNKQFSDAFKDRAKVEFARFVWGIAHGHFNRREIRPIYETMRRYGETDDPAVLDQQGAEGFVAELKALCDAHDISAGVQEPELPTIVADAIKDGLAGKSPVIKTRR